MRVATSFEAQLKAQLEVNMPPARATVYETQRCGGGTSWQIATPK